MAESEPTRKELAEQLEKERGEKAKLEERLARLEAAFAANTETESQRLNREKRLADAEAELAGLRPDAARPLMAPRGPAPKLVPYKGFVRARVDCAYECYRHAGDVFEIDVPGLWSDDPWEPVRVTGDNEDGTPIVNPRTDVTRIDARFRQRAPDAGLLAANQI